jgi:hypothetical protein
MNNQQNFGTLEEEVKKAMPFLPSEIKKDDGVAIQRHFSELKEKEPDRFADLSFFIHAKNPFSFDLAKILFKIRFAALPS